MATGNDRYYTSNMNLGLSNQVLVWVSVGGFTVIFIVLGYLLIKVPQYETSVRRRNPNDPSPIELLPNLRGEDYDEALLHADVSILNRAQRRARAKLQMKKRRRLDTAIPRQNALIHQDPMDMGGIAEDDHDIHDMVRNDQQDQHEEEMNEDDEVEGEEEPINENQILRHSVTRKERQKNAKYQEREERKIYERMRQEKSRLMDEALSREKREKEKAAAEMQERLVHQRKERAREDQERRRLMFFQHQNASSKDVSMTVEDFAQFLRVHKRISLVEMAIELSVSTGELVERVRQLEDEDRIPMPGVFDEKHEYYTLVSRDDMKAIIQRLEETGPISLSSFGKECGEILNQ